MTNNQAPNPTHHALDDMPDQPRRLTRPPLLGPLARIAHDRALEQRLLGPDGLTALEIAQAFYGVEGGREFLVNFLAEHAQPATRADGTERQTWERCTGTIAEQLLHLEVDAEGRVRIHEAIAAQLLLEAGWERTA